MANLVEVRGLKKLFPVGHSFFEGKKKRKYVHAVDGVTFDIVEKETLALVGESGCGKSTTGRLILNLQSATEGRVSFMNQDIYSFGEEEIRKIGATCR